MAAATMEGSSVRIPASKLRRRGDFIPMPAPVRLGVADGRQKVLNAAVCFVWEQVNTSSGLADVGAGLPLQPRHPLLALHRPENLDDPVSSASLVHHLDADAA